ncbi:MAG: hypothetical protein AB1758_09460 [Candidatus Eremiobacterota bacterium]
MARQLILLCVLLALSGPLRAQEVPVEVPLRPPPPAAGARLYQPIPRLLPCPGCDCRGEGCFHTNCGCGGRVDDEAASEMVRYIDHILYQAYGEKLELKRPVRARAITPFELSARGGGEIYGLYDDDVLYVSNALSRSDAFGVLAHEYGHAWQYQHNPDPDRMSGLFSEGFAEWVAYQVLTRVGDFHLASLIRRNGDPEYGDGFRWFLKLEKEHGVDALLDVAVKWVDTEGHPSVAPPD